MAYPKFFVPTFRFYPLGNEELLEILYDLIPSEVFVLLHLRTLNPFGESWLTVSIREVARLLRFNPATVSRALKRLAELDYIERSEVTGRIKILTKGILFNHKYPSSAKRFRAARQARLARRARAKAESTAPDPTPAPAPILLPSLSSDEINYVVEYTAPTHNVFIIQSAPVLSEAILLEVEAPVEEAPVVQDAILTEEAPVVENVILTEEAPLIVEEAPIEELPSIEEPLLIQDSPLVVDSPQVEESVIAEVSLVPQELPALDEHEVEVLPQTISPETTPDLSTLLSLAQPADPTPSLETQQGKGFQVPGINQSAGNRKERALPMEQALYFQTYKLGQKSKPVSKKQPKTKTSSDTPNQTPDRSSQLSQAKPSNRKQTNKQSTSGKPAPPILKSERTARASPLENAPPSTRSSPGQQGIPNHLMDPATWKHFYGPGDDPEFFEYVMWRASYLPTKPVDAECVAEGWIRKQGHLLYPQFLKWKERRNQPAPQALEFPKSLDQIPQQTLPELTLEERLAKYQAIWPVLACRKGILDSLKAYPEWGIRIGKDGPELIKKPEEP